MTSRGEVLRGVGESCALDADLGAEWDTSVVR